MPINERIADYCYDFIQVQGLTSTTLSFRQNKIKTFEKLYNYGQVIVYKINDNGDLTNFGTLEN